MSRMVVFPDHVSLLDKIYRDHCYESFNLILKTRIEAEKIIKGQWMGGLGPFLKQCIFNVISVGPIPTHIAFIMDGNRRFEKKHKLPQGEGHKAGFSSLVVMLTHCYELRVKNVTLYAFSIENFKRKAEEVQLIMDLLLEKIEELLQNGSILYLYGVTRCCILQQLCGHTSVWGHLGWGVLSYQRSSAYLEKRKKQS